jgi:1,2-diacylglycerol-3-alpha-glucose alpha-1,2-galactosyltransferase
MFSSADKVKGQGVGSAYNELVKMLKEQFPEEFEIRINILNLISLTIIQLIHSFIYQLFSKKEEVQELVMSTSYQKL